MAFDNAGDPNVNQFALLGLSDSANAVLMYEKFGFSVRLAYNWRDEYLSNNKRRHPQSELRRGVPAVDLISAISSTTTVGGARRAEPHRGGRALARPHQAAVWSWKIRARATGSERRYKF